MVLSLLPLCPKAALALTHLLACSGPGPRVPPRSARQRVAAVVGMVCVALVANCWLPLPDNSGAAALADVGMLFPFEVMRCSRDLGVCLFGCGLCLADLSCIRF